jgi:hypothetical protein
MPKGTPQLRNTLYSEGETEMEIIHNYSMSKAGLLLLDTTTTTAINNRLKVFGSDEKYCHDYY